MRRVVRFVLAAFAVTAAAAVPWQHAYSAQRTAAAAAPVRDSAFAARIARLSEPAGFFDSDNLSNEASYLHPIGALRALKVRGGAYIGVGPDQSFSYIAAIRPRIAYLIDIRRDNMIQHLMFKALFERSRNRLEYLCRWLGYAVPRDVERWSGRPIEAIVALLDSLSPKESQPATSPGGAVLPYAYGWYVQRYSGQTPAVALRLGRRGRLLCAPATNSRSQARAHPARKRGRLRWNNPLDHAAVEKSPFHRGVLDGLRLRTLAPPPTARPCHGRRTRVFGAVIGGSSTGSASIDRIQAECNRLHLTGGLKRPSREKRLNPSTDGHNQGCREPGRSLHRDGLARS